MSLSTVGTGLFGLMASKQFIFRHLCGPVVSKTWSNLTQTKARITQRAYSLSLPPLELWSGLFCSQAVIGSTNPKQLARALVR